ncbi:hypothetical protein FDI21_gp309 [Pseudomonas phage Noxifer]|uniref:Uncharacterized protein n=1 Tax=Pseudomonas phage Noxifer TaxID=2006684 RepID=A0A1Y0SV55_9CAUD|nr:hypothetical protein FDI21_gp309 [Pseudomonas phage Noxifer]ARV77402.1 hypothetical protein NOXIFER_237 [Pseudomonas phage Noxifer]
MKEFGQIDTLALYKRLRHREPKNYRLDRILMSGINESDDVKEPKVEELGQRGFAALRRNILPGTRALLRISDKPLDLSKLNPSYLEQLKPEPVVKPTASMVMLTIELLSRLATEMGDVAHSEEGYTDFDGFAFAAIYVDRVIKEQFAGELPSPMHMELLSRMHLDPLHKNMADRDYLIEPGRLNTTDRVLGLVRDFISFTLDRHWPDEHLEKLAKMKEVDKQLHYIVAPWLRHRRNTDQRIVHVPKPHGLYHDGWLYQKLLDAQQPQDRDFFNVWTTEDSNRLIPRDVLERAVDPSLPPFKKDDV